MEVGHGKPVTERTLRLAAEKTPHAGIIHGESEGVHLPKGCGQCPPIMVCIITGSADFKPSLTVLLSPKEQTKTLDFRSSRNTSRTINTSCFTAPSGGVRLDARSVLDFDHTGRIG